jgi:hypothetical protein
VTIFVTFSEKSAPQGAFAKQLAGPSQNTGRSIRGTALLQRTRRKHRQPNRSDQADATAMQASPQRNSALVHKSMADPWEMYN